MHKFSRSKSSRGGVQPTNIIGLRSCTISRYNPVPQMDDKNTKKELKARKGKKSSGKSIGAVGTKGWSFNMDPELQRKKRVAGYRAYEMQAKMEGSVKKSLRWFKNTCNQVVHGFW